MTTRSKFFLGTLALLIITLLLLQTPLLRTARDTTWRIITTVLARTLSIGDLTVANSVSEQLANLTRENIRLKAELHDYQVLREQLRSPALDSYRAITALVAARALNPWRTELVINRGAVDGISLDAPVIIDGSILVGFISSLADHTATFRLLPHPATSIGADIVSDNYIRTLLKGITHTTVFLTTIPRDAEIYLGQSVVTVGDTTIPAGLLLGSIDTIVANANDAYQNAQLTLPYTAESIKGVTVLVLP